MLETVETLERLSAMWKAGTLSDDEFSAQKAMVLSRLSAPVEQDDSAGWKSFTASGSARWIAACAVIAMLALAITYWTTIGSSSAGVSGEEGLDSSLDGESGQAAADESCKSRYAITWFAQSSMAMGPYDQYSGGYPSAIVSYLRDNEVVDWQIRSVDGECRLMYGADFQYNGTSYSFSASCPFPAKDLKPSDKPGQQVLQSLPLNECTFRG